MPPALVKFTAAKKENGNVIGTTFEFNAFTDLDGKVSFTVGYNLQKSSQWIHLEVDYCSFDPDEGRSCPYREIQYDEALAQSAGTGIAVITKSMVLPA